jgi:hypothetical protein
MALRSFSLRQMMLAVFWLSCALGAFVAPQQLWENNQHAAAFIACFLLWFLGIPVFVALSVGTIFGTRSGCFGAAAAFSMAIAWLSPLRLSPADIVRLGVVPFGLFVLLYAWKRRRNQRNLLSQRADTKQTNADSAK